ncbi:hypothetical protein BDP81DRAFT_398565 [Colletotrichum phormii]|uniref:Nudix hydrolase domain-containing protein n=1 Tax=Colletotrichum phormii TaxID=359342 RepID=A0AAJ0EAC9_9PEZI|nr:uncharacterized protein BDP81DRAFT_398565 [Colletotrichum phormii]KAK1624481.1 hypothetical protein BDP81DRAFT_398565 [Colletotrichum phormii]
MDILTLSRRDMLSWLDLRAQIPPPKIMVGAAIIRRGPGGTETLILKNRPNHGISRKLHEIPGGEMKGSDDTVEDAILRVVAESVGLLVIDIGNCLPPTLDIQEETVEYGSAKEEGTAENDAAGPSAQTTVIKRPVVHFNFVIIVGGDGNDFQLNEEHEMGIWVDAEKSVDIDMGDAMRKVINKALEFSYM